MDEWSSRLLHDFAKDRLDMCPIRPYVRESVRLGRASVGGPCVKVLHRPLGARSLTCGGLTSPLARRAAPPSNGSYLDIPLEVFLLMTPVEVTQCVEVEVERQPR